MTIEDIYKLYTRHYRVVKDTREDVTNALYFALTGSSFNGNKFALDALNKGAAFAVIDEPEYKIDDRFILVEDALTCLQELARYHRQKINVPVFALTGSNGKTTTKELLSAVLNMKYNCHATRGNLNNHIGVPLTLLSMTPEHNFCIVEMGANHLKEIDGLCRISLPDFGYITNFGRVHLEGFGSFEGVIQGKTELYRHLKTHGKKLFVNCEDAIQMEKSMGMDRILIGESGTAFDLSFVKADPFVSIAFEEMKMNSNLIGAYNFDNIKLAVCAGKYFGIKTELIKTAIEGFIPNNNRSQVINRGSNKIIMDAYNANPNSMEAALTNLKSLSADHKIAILGDMFEIGADSIQEHAQIAKLADSAGLAEVYLIGEEFSSAGVENDKVMTFTTFEDFAKDFKKKTYQDTTFLIKASRGMALERVLELL